MKAFQILGLVCLTTAVASADAAVTLKAGHISPKPSAEGVAADRFAELVKEKTKGEISVEMYPSEQLGKATAMVDSTILGNQDIYIGGSPEFEKLSPALKVFGINYAVDSKEHMSKILKSPLWKEVNDAPLDKAGLTVLASNWERTPYRVLVSTKPVRSFADVNGLKLRIPPIDTWRRSWQALGAQVVVLPWTDVYLGLKQGTVDAVTSPISLLYSMKFTEVAKHVARIDELWIVLEVVMNKKKFQSLNPRHQKALYEAAEQAGREFMKMTETLADQELQRMKKEHGITYTEIDTGPARAKMVSVIRELEKQGAVPAGVYDRLQQLK